MGQHANIILNKAGSHVNGAGPSLSTKKQPPNSNLIAISKPSQKDRATKQDPGTTGVYSHGNDDRSTGEISNQGQPALPLAAGNQAQ